MERALTKIIEDLEGDKSKLGFAPQRVMFKVMGCFWWEKPSLIKRIYTFLFMGIQLASVISVTSFLMNTKIKTADDFTEIIDCLIKLIPFVAGIIKLGILHVKWNNFKTMIDFLESFPHDGVVFPAWRMFLAHYFAGFITVANWGIYGTITRGWPWNAAFPWDTSTHTGHCLGIAFQLFAGSICGFTHLCISSVVVAAMGRIMPQIRRLKVVYSKIGPNLEENNLTIREAVDLHSAIQRGVGLLNSAIGPVFMFKFISLAPLICINAFLVTKIGEVQIGHVITCVLPMGILVCAELYMFFGPGQQIATEMEHMEHFCCDNEWYLAPLHTRRELSMIIECSRKQLTMNAYGVAYANNATLLAVVQQGYSYLLFLHTMADTIDSN